MSTRIRVKICCIASVEEARTAIKSGADAVGLVSEMPSGPGVISEAEIAAIASEIPPHISTFLLTSKVNAAEIIKQHGQCGTTTIQLVDAIAGDELRFLKRSLPVVDLVQVIHVTGPEAVTQALEVQDLVDYILLDSGNPLAANRELGGTGRVHNWEISARIVAECGKPVFLAGGLDPENVTLAVQRVRPYGVDVCSGVRTRGKLDTNRLNEFIRAL